MLKILKKIRKQILLKEYILSGIAKNISNKKMIKEIDNILDVIILHKTIIEEEILILNKNYKFKGLNLDTIVTLNSYKKLEEITNANFQQQKVAIVKLIDGLINDINNFLSINGTKDEMDKVIYLPNTLISDLKNIKDRYRKIIDEFILIFE